MATTIRKHQFLTAALQGAGTEAGRFVGFVAHLPEPTSLLSLAACRLAAKTDPYRSRAWLIHVMNQGGLRAGRPAV